MWDAWVHSDDGLGSGNRVGNTEFPEVAGEVPEYISMSVAFWASSPSQ